MSDGAKTEPTGTARLLIDVGPLLVFFLVNSCGTSPMRLRAWR